MTRYTLEEAKYILGILAGRETGLTTATQSRDAIRTVLDHLADEPECEYGYTSKWGTIAASSQADAETRAAELSRSIRENRESGNLTYHGKVMMRIAASKPGEWVPAES